MKYKNIVEQITYISWALLNPSKIIYVSWASAIEFAESLRCALQAYPGNENLLEMARGELMTTNLQFGTYNKAGDHSEFLDHFIKIEPNLIRLRSNKKLEKSISTYWDSVRNLSDNQRAMTVFSREQELPGIFERILKSTNWDIFGFGFYKYYLERHIELDSTSGGHGDLTKDFELDEEVLFNFYLARLRLYEAIH